MSAIPLGPAPEEQIGNGTKMEIETKQEPSTKDNKYFFADEVKIGDQTLIKIDAEKQFYEETKPPRKSRWGGRPLKKKPKTDVVFNPLNAITGNTLLPISDAVDPSKPYNYLSNPNIINPPNSKWGPEWEKTFTPPPLSDIPYGISLDEAEYIIRLYRLDEITRRNSMNDYESQDPDLRSPSPEPVYDPKTGMRVNTRPNRVKLALEKEKHLLMEELMKINPQFVVSLENKQAAFKL